MKSSCVGSPPLITKVFNGMKEKQRRLEGESRGDSLIALWEERVTEHIVYLSFLYWSRTDSKLHKTVMSTKATQSLSYDPTLISSIRLGNYFFL